MTEDSARSERRGSASATSGEAAGSVRVEVLSWVARGLGGQREDKAVWDEPIGEVETLGELMDRLAGRFPSFGAFYDPSERRLEEHVELVLNGRLYDLVGGFEARLEAGDTVMIFPGFSGGSGVWR